MTGSRNGAPPQRWNGLVSASLNALQDEAVQEQPAEIEESTEPSAVDDLISKAAVAVEGHAAAAQLSRARMARLSADAAATRRSAIVGETPTTPGMPSRGVTSGTKLDVQR